MKKIFIMLILSVLVLIPKTTINAYGFTNLYDLTPQLETYNYYSSIWGIRILAKGAD